jgi:hypothetical protein
MLKVHVTVPKAGWAMRVNIVVSMATPLTIISVNVNLVTMVWIVQHFAQTRAVSVSRASVIVDLRDGEENFVREEDVQV